MKILVTGGCGYIGSHSVVELLRSGHQVVIVDNLVNSSVKVLKRLEKITQQEVPFIQLDLANKIDLESVFEDNDFDAVIHFAGLKAVGESVENPLMYYRTNLGTTISLLEVMDKFKVKQLVFSSSATVYGNQTKMPLKEEYKIGVGITNPYGQTKYIIEKILEDLSITNNGWQITSLRYFNPIGAHKSGLIGESPSGKPNNLMPFISQVAVGKRDFLSVFGNDYPTTDGTGVRDYIHVVDLAKAHIKAIEKPASPNKYRALNIGTGRGISVLELINSFQKTNNIKIPYKIEARRLGDVAECYADPSRAKKELDWQTELSLDDACSDTWRWQSNNPSGY